MARHHYYFSLEHRFNSVRSDTFPRDATMGENKGLKRINAVSSPLDSRTVPPPLLPGRIHHVEDGESFNTFGEEPSKRPLQKMLAPDRLK